MSNNTLNQQVIGGNSFPGVNNSITLGNDSTVATILKGSVTASDYDGVLIRSLPTNQQVIGGNSFPGVNNSITLGNNSTTSVYTPGIINSRHASGSQYISMVGNIFSLINTSNTGIPTDIKISSEDSVEYIDFIVGNNEVLKLNSNLLEIFVPINVYNKLSIYPGNYINWQVPTTDATITGNTISDFSTGATITAGDLVCLNSSAQWVLADADAQSTSIGLLGISMESKTSGQTMRVALPGSLVRFNTWNWTVGSPLYVSSTSGSMSHNIPTGTGKVVKTVGWAVNADYIYFYPSQDYQVLV